MTRRGTALPRARLVTLVLAALLLAGCGSKQDALAPHSRSARGISSLWWDMLAGSILALGIVVLILLAAYVRRNRPGFPGRPDADRAGLCVVLGLGIVMPIVVLSALFVFANIFLIRDTTLPTASAAPRDRRADGARRSATSAGGRSATRARRAVTANEIHIPVRTPVEVLVHTDDVIHSFWVPQLNRKIDMIPDQTNRDPALRRPAPAATAASAPSSAACSTRTWACYVFADPPARFRALARAPVEAARAAADARLFVVDVRRAATRSAARARERRRARPHARRLADVARARSTIPNTPERLREWIRDPQRVKPGNQMPDARPADAELRALVAYLEARR